MYSNMKKILIISLIIIFLTACSQGYTIITSTEAQDLLSQGAVLVDVRTYEEHEKYYIKDSVNVPLDNIESISDLVDGKDSIIILYCQTGQRSKEAAKELAKLGYTNVYSLDGGLINWGYGIEEGE